MAHQSVLGIEGAIIKIILIGASSFNNVIIPLGIVLFYLYKD